MSEPTVLSAMRDVIALWYVDRSTCADIVYAACDLLAADFDGPSLRLLGAVLIDEAAQHAGLRAMASRTLTGAITPRELTAWAHGRFGHTGLELAELLAPLDDNYDTAVNLEEIDAEVLAEARLIVGSSPAV